ncbi:MAG TPA: gluconate 2-dehydrogenase subunit 3 family protein [Vicinamibacteria bacterium]
MSEKASRRRVLQVLAGGVGGALAVPAGAAAQGHGHAAPAPTTAPPTAPPGPAFLDAHQLETVASLAEAIVPGAAAAGVAPFVDRVLAADTPERQREFLAALGAIQAESAARFGRPWLGLAPAQKTELLTAVSTGHPSREPSYWTPGEPVLAPPPAPAPPTLRDRFDLLKDRIATAYYSSEAGMRELGWTGEMVHAEAPGCAHPGGHP